MLAEAREKRLFAAPEKARKFLQRNPQEVKNLTAYWMNTERLLALNLILLPCEEKIVMGAQTVRLGSGLLTNDSVIVATMREYGISNIATNDGMFDSVFGVSMFRPNDI
jgi:predicted nucleic acid-binding protein